MAYSNVTPPELPDYSAVTHYLYNGVELPALPEWDKTAYPYACIGDEATNVHRTTHILFLCVNQPEEFEDAFIYTPAGGRKVYYLTNGAWVLKYNNSSDGRFVSRAMWSNFDYLLSDGALYLAASDPVPISQYPYSIIAFNYEKGTEDWYQVHLWYSAAPFTWNGSAVVNGGTAYTQIYASVDGVTGWTDALETDVEATPGLDGTTYQRIWTDHDILDADGNVWLPAGEVTPVEETVSAVWLKSFKMGLALGLCGKPLPFKGEPVAYLYNGVRLPPLPEWDETAYPYISIVSTDGVNYSLHIYPVPIKVTSLTGKLYWEIDGITPTEIWYFTQGNDTVWNGHIETVYVPTQGSLLSNFDFFWSNHDIVSIADSAVWCAASDPVPVYE